MSSVLKVLMLGDVIGKTGKCMFARHLPSIKTEYNIDAVIVNGENSADDGLGITPQDAQFFIDHGADIITTGNHIWDKSNFFSYLDVHTTVIRPANFPDAAPGKGITFFECNGFLVCVMNFMGRVFMDQTPRCPFKKADELIQEAVVKTPIVLIDFHAEATSEKLGFAYYLDGRITAVVGTHTHTQTNDARILPGGTAYITDLGMTGSLYSAIGFSCEDALQEMVTCIPQQLRVETRPPYTMTGALITIDTATGKALAIEKFSRIDTEPLEGCV